GIDGAGIPPSVRDIVRSRAGRLSEEVRAALTMASVMGQRFDADLLAAVLGVDVDAVIDSVDDAVGAQLIAEEGVGRYRFEHALVRGALYGEISRTNRARMHLRVGQQLSSLRPDDVGALANHWYQAAGLSHEARERAIAYAMAGGEQAMATGAPDAALDSFNRALELVDASGAQGAVRRADVLLRVGIASRTTGRFDHRVYLEAAARAALEDGRPIVAAQALLEDRNVAFSNGDISAERRAMQEELVRSPELPSKLRTLMLAQRAKDAFLCHDPHYRARVVDEAWAALQATPNDDVETRLGLVDMPPAVDVSLRPELIDEMLACLADLADRVSGRDQLLTDFTLVVGNIRMGRLQRAMRHADRMAFAAKQLREPFLLALPLFSRACAQLALGRIDDAARDLDALDKLFDRVGDADVPQWGLAVRICRAVQTGSTADYADASVFAAESFPDNPAWEACAAGTLAMAGRTAEARQWLDRLAARDFDS